jgi:ABC-type bacteriocin/lantibiotic exporter with double-glycine peptidase domain
VVQSSFPLMQKYLRTSRTEWKPFVIYGVCYALLSLLVPLIVQLLVNNLALVGLNLSLVTLSIILAIGLSLLQLSRLGQIVLLEYLERKLIARLTPRFSAISTGEKTYFFELASVPKSLSKWALEGFEILLALIVGSIILMVYHPFFIALTLLIWLSLWGVYWLGKRGLSSALEESNQKYKLWAALERCEKGLTANDWLRARDVHFEILRRQILLLMAAQIVGTVALMTVGALLFNAGELSLGQFVAAELIGGGVFMTLSKLCKFMESHYALITSFIKSDRALEGHHG